MRMRVGIDEVGRGCLAGPVTVCAVLITGKFKKPGDLPKLRDSKKMTRLQRRAWYEWIKERGKEKGIYFALASVSPEVIDRINITRAANSAAWRAFKKLGGLMEGGFSDARIVLDGGLFLKNKAFQSSSTAVDGVKISAQTVIRADAEFNEVKMASVIAKVIRDERMGKLARKHPDYGLEVHKGYGTRLHIKAIRDKGAVDGLHRKTFIGGLT